ncbi:MAG: hypothetical protein HQ472_05135 [Ignavibacteria bacterium]|nr:hypothetical protein [Ignavibacteria bacterium]
MAVNIVVRKICTCVTNAAIRKGHTQNVVATKISASYDCLVNSSQALVFQFLGNTYPFNPSNRIYTIITIQPSTGSAWVID